MENFTLLGLPASVLASLESMQITTPSPIQKETIPLALEGSDILASAQTGSGKTLAYGVPLIVKLLNRKGASALVLAPTRELALQVRQMLARVAGTETPLRSALLIGGAPMGKQIDELKRNPQLIIGTPGRINDHLQRGTLKLAGTEFLVIDEADRMLDMGFGVQLDRIAKYLPEKRQTLLFSATLPPNIESLSKKYLKEPKRVTIALEEKSAPKIKQEIVHTTNSEKHAQLLKELEIREGSIIVFVKTKFGAERLSKRLKEEGHLSDAIHGNLRQNRRDRVIQGFRSQKSRILVATDIAARGLDIPHVLHVINFDLPQAPEDYIHRIGRTGRAGAEGFALCLLTKEDGPKWREISRLMNPNEAQRQGEVRTPKPFRRARRRFR
jgi:superfamily II DNA/RNA helicase